ncbi:cytochrome P450 [Daedaleopsis nitida]|nr:cytochrome P450 [Daedaleopsis nitida]
MSSLLVQGAIVCAVTLLLWNLFGQLFVSSPLDNIPGPPSDSFIYGNVRQLMHRKGWGFIQHLSESYPGIAKLHGPIGKRMLYVFDPLAMHHIVVKDDHIFKEPRFIVKSNVIRFGPGLSATSGERHRKQRKMLNPVFSIAHMRRMIPIFTKVVHQLQKAIEDRVGGHDEPVELDMLSWMSRTALELIGQAGLGYSFDPLVADDQDEFADAVKALQPTTSSVHHFRRLAPYLPDRSSVRLRRAFLSMVPHAGIQKLMALVDTLQRRSGEIYEAKKRALESGDEEVARQIGEGKDLMSILMRANLEADEGDKLPEEEVIAQMSTFIFAGMDTTSNALSITLELLANHPDVQQRLRTEILEAMMGKESLDYDALVSLPYLDAVCRETLRLHSPSTSSFREAYHDGVLPLSQPIRGVDGRMMHEIVVPAGTAIVVGLLAANRNKALWGEDALEWKPERWLSPLPASVLDAKIPGVYANLMTFMGGGRACIGFKFSQLEMKTVLCSLLSKFTFAPSGKEIVWNLAGIRFPTVGDGPKPSLPLKVGIYRATDLKA